MALPLSPLSMSLPSLCYRSVVQSTAYMWHNKLNVSVSKTQALRHNIQRTVFPIGIIYVFHKQQQQKCLNVSLAHLKFIFFFQIDIESQKWPLEWSPEWNIERASIGASNWDFVKKLFLMEIVFFGAWILLHEKRIVKSTTHTVFGCIRSAKR